MDRHREWLVKVEQSADGRRGRTCLLESRDVVGASGAESGLCVGVFLFPVSLVNHVRAAVV